MKSTELLKEDHERLRKLFKRVKDTTLSEYPAIFKQIDVELNVHTHIEETVLYPVLLKRGKKDLKDITREGLEEHAQCTRFQEELRKITIRNKQYEAKLDVLIEDVEHHLKEEEKVMFPMIDDQLSATANEKVAEEMELERAREIEKLSPAQKKALKASYAYAENHKGALEKVLDKAKDIAASVFGESTGKAKATKPARAKNADGKTKKPAAKAKKSSSSSEMKASLRKTQAARAAK